MNMGVLMSELTLSLWWGFGGLCGVCSGCLGVLWGEYWDIVRGIAMMNSIANKKVKIKRPFVF